MTESEKHAWQWRNQTSIYAALAHLSATITAANVFPPVSVGLSEGQMQQLRDELDEAGDSLRGTWSDDGTTVTLFLPDGALEVREEKVR